MPILKSPHRITREPSGHGCRCRTSGAPDAPSPHGLHTICHRETKHRPEEQKIYTAPKSASKRRSLSARSRTTISGPSADCIARRVLFSYLPLILKHLSIIHRRLSIRQDSRMILISAARGLKFELTLCGRRRILALSHWASWVAQKEVRFALSD